MTTYIPPGHCGDGVETAAAERCPTCTAAAPYWRPDDRECEICLAITEVPSTLNELASDVEDGYGPVVVGEHVKYLRQKHALLVEHVGTLLADRKRMAAELEQVRNDSSEAWLAERNEEMRDATLEAAGLLARLAGPGPCEVDADGELSMAEAVALAAVQLGHQQPVRAGDAR